MLFGLLGVFLIGYVAPNLDDADKGFAFEPPPEPLKIVLRPQPLVVTAIGIIFVLTAVATFFERRSKRLASGSLLLVLATVLLIPLVLVLCARPVRRRRTPTSPSCWWSRSASSTPIALGAMAGLWCERSGVVNIGIEGMMLASAATGFIDLRRRRRRAGHVRPVARGRGGRPHRRAHRARCTRSCRVTSGSTRSSPVWSSTCSPSGSPGSCAPRSSSPTGISTGVPTPTIAMPAARPTSRSSGDQLFTNQPIFFAMFVIVGLTGLVLCRHTRFGLRVRSVGENPHAAETLGIDVDHASATRPWSSAALIAGLAGAWFSLESQAGFEDNMTNGTGFIALAALIFGKWRPWTAFAGAMLFGFTRALGARLQFLGVDDRRLLDPQRVLAGAAVRRHDHRRRRRGRAGHAPGGRRHPVRAIPMSRRIDWTALRGGGRRAPATRAYVPYSRLPRRRGGSGRRRAGRSRRATSRTPRTA